jgi:hypothetical protein
MRAIEFLKEAEVAAKKKLGRAFNHLEDLVFFHGSSGTLEALAHVREIATEEGSQTVRMKWDGNPQIYWGRETKGGPLVLAGHNGWSRGAMTTSPEEVEDFIANKSGTPKTPEDKRARDQFAKQFASLYPLFDKATPRDFVGFVYADGLFLQQPQVDQQGVYTFCPNPKSKTCYHVRADSELGQRIASAQVMVVGHAFFPQFGMPDDEQKPMDDFSMFNGTAQLIVQGPVYNSSPVSVGSDKIAAVEAYLKQNAKGIDSFLQETPGLGDLKNILYTFVNQTAKAKQLANLNANNFFNWLTTSKVSTNKQTKIKELAQLNQNALEAVFSLVTQIMELKDDVIQQIESGAQGEIWDTEGEGRVRYADKNKQFGNVKLVPRKRWTPT